jgi:hypothetical protein
MGVATAHLGRHRPVPCTLTKRPPAFDQLGSESRAVTGPVQDACNAFALSRGDSASSGGGRRQIVGATAILIAAAGMNLGWTLWRAKPPVASPHPIK